MLGGKVKRLLKIEKVANLEMHFVNYVIHRVSVFKRLPLFLWKYKNQLYNLSILSTLMESMSLFKNFNEDKNAEYITLWRLR